MAAATSELIGKILQGTYKVERLIGEGGMGCVYEASHTRVRRRFAIKVLAGAVARDAEAVARFRREAEITSELGHPNIVEVIDFNATEDGSPYLVMELLQGEALDRRLASQPRLPLAEVQAILDQAASALHAAHQHQIVHRDLKPQNIFLQQGPRGEQVKILDFGISKVLGSTSLMTGAFTLMGTPGYMSPEQAEGRNDQIDARTDVFAMGIILYEMLAGRPPFLGQTVPAILFQVVHQAPPDLKSLRPDLPYGVVAAVARAMSKSREERHSDIVELSQEFCAGLSTAPVDRSAVPPTVPVAMAETMAAPTPGPVLPTAPGIPSRVPQAVSAGPVGTTMSAGSGEAQVRSLDEPMRRNPLPLVLAASAVIVAAGLGLYLGVLRRPSPGPGSGSAVQRPAVAAPDAASGVAARAPDAGPPAPDRARPDHAAPRPDRARVVPAAPSFGRLSVVVRLAEEKDPLKTSFGQAWLDGREIKDGAPFGNLKVEAGVAHRLEVHRNGYRPSRQTFTVPPGKARTIVIRLQKQ
jgi:eukaryotic-like serine/threonine-protein kinase